MKEGRKDKKKINNRLLYTLISLGILLILAGGVYAVDTTQAWHNANQIDFAGVEINPSKVTAPTICIGSDCKTAWPVTTIPSDLSVTKLTASNLCIGSDCKTAWPSPTLSPSCPTGYSKAVNLCYKEVIQSGKWYDANSFCGAEGTSLCSIAQIEVIDDYYDCSTGKKYWTSSMTGVSWGSMTTLVAVSSAGGFCAGSEKDWNINSYTIDGENAFFCCKQI